MYLLEFAGEDDAFAAAEATSAATGVEVVATGVGQANAVEPARLRGLAFTRRASELLARTDADVGAARAALEAAPLDRSGSVAVRARDVRGTAGIDTQRAERELGRVLVDRGLSVDLESPELELRAVFADDRCALGWLAVEAERAFGARAPTEKPFFQPGSMDPIEARAVVNLAGARPGRTVLDPMCGTGGVLVEAGLLGARVVGFDVQGKMVRGARTNLAHFLGGAGRGGDGHTPADGGQGRLPPCPFDVGLGDAARLPFADDAVDAVVFDAPYGRQSKVESVDAGSLLSAAFVEARRVAPRAVVVTDADRRRAARGAGWTVEGVYPRRVHRSLTRYVHVLARPERGE